MYSTHVSVLFKIMIWSPTEFFLLCLTFGSFWVQRNYQLGSFPNANLEKNHCEGNRWVHSRNSGNGLPVKQAALRRLGLNYPPMLSHTLCPWPRTRTLAYLPFSYRKLLNSLLSRKHLAVLIGYKGLFIQQLRKPENLKSNIQNTYQPFTSPQIIKTSEEWTYISNMKT